MTRQNSLKRRQSLRSPKRKFVIFCEGSNTEPDYFRAIKQRFVGAIIDIEILGAAGVPSTIARKAVAEIAAIRRDNRRSKQTFGNLDEVWAVFDEDAHPHVAQAIAKCRDAGVGVAYSNPCFELWLVLHIQNFDQACDRHTIQRHLEGVCAEYDRKSGKSPNCNELVKSVSTAETRAEAQFQRRIDEGSLMGPPSTTVHLLTKALREASAGFSPS